MEKNNSLFTFKNLSTISGLVHGVSTRKHGGMKIGKEKTISSLRPFLQTLNVPEGNVVGMYQVHGSHVKKVSQKEKGSLASETDGLWTNEKNLFVYGGYADCTPVLFYDKSKEYCGVAHSGWRGTHKEIVKQIVKQMRQAGSHPADILVGIGPSIRGCCYDITEERFLTLKEKFPGVYRYTRREGIRYFLDIGNLIVMQLEENGIQRENIEDCGICTSDEDDTWFSYRKTKDKAAYNTFAAIIGRI